MWDGAWVVRTGAHTAKARDDGCAERRAEAHVGERAGDTAGGCGLEVRWWRLLGGGGLRVKRVVREEGQEEVG